MKGGSIVENLGKVHADAGLRGRRRATPKQLPFATLVNAAGDTIHSTSHEGHEPGDVVPLGGATEVRREIGGGIVASTMIQKIISDKKGHVVVEPQPKMRDARTQ